MPKRSANKSRSAWAFTVRDPEVTQVQREANRISEEKKPKILLDTTYLLPLFGVDVGLEQFDSKFPKMVRECEILYNQASLIEAKWIVLNLLKKEQQREKKQEFLDVYIAGLETLSSPMERLNAVPVLTSPNIEKISLITCFSNSE